MNADGCVFIGPETYSFGLRSEGQNDIRPDASFIAPAQLRGAAMESKRIQGLGALLIGVSLIGVGALFLLGQIFRFNVWAVLWPFFIIGPGLLFFLGMVALGKTGAPLAIPGSIVTMVGLILLYSAITGHWSSWAYAWALIAPTAVGVGIAIMGLWADDPRTARAGGVVAAIGLAIFLFFGVFFELVLNISGFAGGWFGRIIVPLLLMGAGAAVLVLALVRRR